MIVLMETYNTLETAGNKQIIKPYYVLFQHMARGIRYKTRKTDMEKTDHKNLLCAV